MQFLDTSTFRENIKQYEESPAKVGRFNERLWDTTNQNLDVCLREIFDFIEGHPSLRFGGVLLTNCPTPVQVAGCPLFSIKPPELPGEPFRFSGMFTDSTGVVSLVIEENEWQAATRAWDIEVGGGRITIREAQKSIHLVLRVEPPTEIIVEKLDMSLAGFHFYATGDSLCVRFPSGGVNRYTRCIADHSLIGMQF